jgi:hypothetical protein
MLYSVTSVFMSKEIKIYNNNNICRYRWKLSYRECVMPWNWFKGTFQRKLTGILSGINRQLMTCHCSDGYSFYNLKGLHSLKSKNVFSALTGTLL